MSKITYTNKVDKRSSGATTTTKISASDMNEIKASVNALYDGEGGSLVIASKRVTPAEILAANSSPIEIVAAPGADKVLVPEKLFVKLDYNSSEYLTNTSIQIRWQNTTATIISLSNFLSGTVDKYGINDGIIQTTELIENEGLELFVPNGNPVNGGSDVLLFLFYSLLDLSSI